jgi:hypothetical protein
VPWARVTEIHTRPLGEVAAALAEDLAGTVARLVPVPGAGFVTRAVTSRITGAVTEVVSGLVRNAVHERGSAAQVPCRITYRGRWKGADVRPDVFSSAVFCLPDVTTSIVVTAEEHGIPVTPARPG